VACVQRLDRRVVVVHEIRVVEAVARQHAVGDDRREAGVVAADRDQEIVDPGVPDNRAHLVDLRRERGARGLDPAIGAEDAGRDLRT
jgi:hypothetical protein